MKMYVVDAFADQLFAGNPAAVCPVPEWPDDGIMQKIAAENNLPETAFMVREEDGYAIRWFTPRDEVDLCGHATLASAFVVHNYIQPGLRGISFRSQSGMLTVGCRDGVYTLDFPSRPAEPCGKVERLEEALGLPVREYYRSRDLMVVVEDEEMVRNAAPDFLLLSAIKEGDGVIVTARGTNCDFVSRCFYPKSGVNEDPVTGSAHCNLIPYWAERLHKEELTARQLSERGGTLHCRKANDRVLIGGTAVLYSAAEVYL